jgi:hypothetical protein
MLSESGDTPYTKALAAYLDGWKAVDFINEDERFDALPPSPVVDGAVNGVVDGMRELERALAEAPCTEDEFGAKMSFLVKEYLLDHISPDILHLAIDSREQQKEAEEMARYLKRRAAEAETV